MKLKKTHSTVGTIPAALGIGWLAGIAATLLLAAIISAFVMGGRINDRLISPLAVVTVITAALTAAFVTAKKAGQKRLVLCLANGALYYISLFCMTALFFDGRFQGLLGGLMTVMGSALVAGLLGMKQKTQKSRYLKRRYKP